jgi:hypothetical protein
MLSDKDQACFHEHVLSVNLGSCFMFFAYSISVAKRLERVAIEYNQMQYLVTKGASLPFVTNIDWVGHSFGLSLTK